MRQPSVKILDMWGHEIHAGDIVAELRNQRFLYFVPVDFTEHAALVTIHCKTAGSREKGKDIKYGNKNIPCTLTKHGDVEWNGCLIVTQDFINKYGHMSPTMYSGDDTLVELSNNTHNWPSATTKTNVRQQPYFIKWFRGFQKAIKSELGLAKGNGHRGWYRRDTKFTTGHNGDTSTTRISIDKTVKSLHIVVNEGTSYYNAAQIAEFKAGPVISQTAFEMDKDKPFEHPEFINFISDFCKTNGIAI